MWHRIASRAAGLAALALALASCATGLSTPDDPAATRPASLPSAPPTPKPDATASAKKVCAVYYQAVQEENLVEDEFWSFHKGTHLDFTDIQFIGGLVVDMVTTERYWSLQVAKNITHDLPATLKQYLNEALEKDWDHAAGYFGDQTIDNLVKVSKEAERACEKASLECKKYR